jgi:hypothetical protein
MPETQDCHSLWKQLRVAVLLCLFLTCVYMLTSPGRARSIDEIDPVMQSESLLLRHSTAIPQAIGSGIYFGKVDNHGVPRSAWPSGHAWMILPWSAVGHYVFAKLPGIPPTIADLAITTATSWSSAFYAALAVAASFLLFLRISGSKRSAMVCSLIVAFSTPLFVYSGWLFSEPASAAIFVIAAVLLFGTGTQPSMASAVSAAVLLGFSAHIRPANMLTVFVFIAASLLLKPADEKHSRFRATWILLVIVGVGGLLYLWRNHLYFGNALDFGVPPTAENGKDLESWHNPFWRGVAGFLVSPGKSALLFCPPAILAIAALPRLWKRNRALAFLATIAPIANLVLYSFRTQWEGSYCYGPRYLVPSLALLCLSLGALFTDPPTWLRPALWAVAISGFAVQVIGLSVNVLEDMTRNHYYDAHWDYQFFYSPIPGQFALIWKYLHTKPSAIGLGWDRWWILLHAAGASSGTLAAIVCVLAAGALVFGFLLMKAFQTANAEGTE